MSDEEQDSDDAELERMFGKPSDNKKALEEEEVSEEEEKPKPLTIVGAAVNQTGML